MLELEVALVRLQLVQLMGVCQSVCVLAFTLWHTGKLTFGGSGLIASIGPFSGGTFPATASLGGLLDLG